MTVRCSSWRSAASLCVRQNDDKVFFEFSSLQVSTKWLKALSVFSCVFLKEHFLLLFLSPLAQSELEEMSQPISCGIQREQSHYWLMRRRGIEAFILITVMCVCKRAPCTCFSLPPNIIFIFFLFFCSSTELRMNPHSQGGKLICGFRFISMIIIRSRLHLPLSAAAERKPGDEPNLSQRLSCFSQCRRDYWLTSGPVSRWDGCTCGSHLCGTASHFSPPAE